MGFWTVGRQPHHQCHQRPSSKLFLSLFALLHLLLLPCIVAIANSEDDVLTDAEPKRGGARAFHFAPDEKRAGARAFYFAPDEKRGGARAFNFAPDEKRGGARAFNFAPEEKRAGGRAFSPLQKKGGARAFRDDSDALYQQPLITELKRAGARIFHLEEPSSADETQLRFVPEETKRGGARPFFGGGYMDGAWKRAGGRYFMRHFDDSPFSGWAVKRGGGRSFFGGMGALFGRSNYWAPQRFVRPVVGKYFVAGANGAKRGGARAFNDGGELLDGIDWEKRAGGRSFVDHDDMVDESKEKRFAVDLSGY